MSSLFIRVFFNQLIINNFSFSVKDEQGIGYQIKKECSKIFPLEDNCMVRKVKLLKKPKFDLTKLMELYKDNQAQPAPSAAQNKLADKWESKWTKIL